MRVGDDWATGFLFGSSRHVLTSFLHVDASDDPQVVGADSVLRPARVVAWSTEDDLALLELDEELRAPPLTPAATEPEVGSAIAALYHPADPDADEETAREWSTPVALFGRVGRVLETEVDLDVALWGRLGDAGAPIVNAEGRVIAMVSCRSVEKRRMIATRVARPARLFELRDQQGEFSPSAETGLLSGFFLTPRHADGFVGLGFVVGWRYEWFALTLYEGFFQTAHRPIGDDAFQATERFQLELDAEIQLKLGSTVRIFFGPGVQLNFDDTELIEDATSSAPITSDDNETQVRPAGTVGVAASVLFVRVGISEQPRVDIGIMIGR